MSTNYWPFWLIMTMIKWILCRENVVALSVEWANKKYSDKQNVSFYWFSFKTWYLSLYFRWQLFIAKVWRFFHLCLHGCVFPSLLITIHHEIKSLCRCLLPSFLTPPWSLIEYKTPRTIYQPPAHSTPKNNCH